jgi:hypothetical protein
LGLGYFGLSFSRGQYSDSPDDSVTAEIRHYAFYFYLVVILFTLPQMHRLLAPIYTLDTCLYRLYDGWSADHQKHQLHDTNTRRFHIPGSWLPLLLACSFFAVKYAMGATYALMPEMRTNLALMSFDVAVSALIAGLAWGRFTVYLLTYQRNTRGN